MPKFTVENLMGESVSLLVDNGKPTLVNIWATWCTPCLQEMPDLELLAEAGAFNVIALSTDSDRQNVINFANKNNFSKMNILFDIFGRNARKYLNAKSLPMTFVVDASGIVKNIYMGEKEWKDDTFYKSLLKQVGLVK